MKLRARLLVLALTLFAGLLPLRVEAQRAPKYDALYTFGDSLADTGNDLIATTTLQLAPPIPPTRTFFAGHFSNGPVAFEYLWAQLSGHAPGTPGGIQPYLSLPALGLRPMPRKEAVDFSFGGSGSGYATRTPGGFVVPGLRAQVELFGTAMHGRKPSNKALFAIVTGSNDYLTVPPAQPATPDTVVANIIASIETLHRYGAKTVMVLNVSDLGTLPLVTMTQPAAAPLLSGLTLAHNQLLATQLSNLSARLPKLTVIPVDINVPLALLPANTILALPALDAVAPAAAGLPPSSLCLFTDARLCPAVLTFTLEAPFFFWDAVHPTTWVHQLLGRYLFARLSS